MKSFLYTLSFICLSLFGQAQSVLLVSDIRTGSGSSGPTSYIYWNNRLYFSADDGFQGRELWSYTGSGPAALVRDLFPGSGSGIELNVSQPTRMAELNGTLYFSGNKDSVGFELMRYTGTGNPSVVADIIPGTVSSSPSGLISTNNKLYFSARQPSGPGNEFYSYSGAGLPVMYDINPGAGSSDPILPTLFKNKIYFSATVNNGREPYVFDPATNVFSMIADIDSGTASSSPNGFLAAPNKLYFVANDGAHGFELYSYDGAQTTRLTDIDSGINNGVMTTSLGYLNGYIYFGGSTNGNNYQLYRMDTATGTASLFKTINNAGSAEPFGFTSHNNKLFFAANNAGVGFELWMTDGTTTSMVADLAPGAQSSTPTSLYEANGTLYMTAVTPTTGAELFRYSESTPSSIHNVAFAGTAKVYPVPTTDNAMLDLSLEKAMTLKVMVTNGIGQTIWTSGMNAYSAGNQTLNIPFSGVSTGIYYYHIANDAGITLTSGSLIKE